MDASEVLMDSTARMRAAEDTDSSFFLFFFLMNEVSDEPSEEDAVRLGFLAGWERAPLPPEPEEVVARGIPEQRSVMAVGCDSPRGGGGTPWGPGAAPAARGGARVPSGE